MGYVENYYVFYANNDADDTRIYQEKDKSRSPGQKTIKVGEKYCL